MLIIRLACDNDVEEIFEVARECQLEEWTKTEYLREISRTDAFLLVAEIESRIVGYIAARFSGIEEVNLPSKIANSFFESDIINFGVLEKHRLRGVGSKLLTEFIKKNAEMKLESIWLEVREKNVNAIKFYEKNGFVKTQIRKNFYKNPIDNAIIMKFDFRKSAQVDKT